MPRRQFRKEILIDYLNSWPFVSLILLCILVILSGLLAYCTTTTYLMGFLYFFIAPYLFICLFLIPMLITTTNVFKIFNENYYLLIRFDSKKDKLRELLKNIFYSNTIVFIIIVTMVLIGLNITCFSKLDFMTKYIFYDVPNIIYVLFFFIRTYFFVIMISIFNGILLEKLSPKFIILLNVIFYGILVIYPYAPITDGRTSILDSSFLIFEYFQLNSYSNFFVEIVCSIFSCLILLLLFRIVLKFFFSKFNIKSLKYILFNDINYIIYSNKYLLIGYFVLLTILCFLSLSIFDYQDNLFNFVLGLQADYNDNYLNIITFFINILTFVFTGTTLYIKDLSKNKSNIFLRIDKSQWVIIKIISLTIIFMLLLLCGYCITFIILMFFGKISTNVFILYFTNLAFLIILELLVLTFIYGNLILKIIIGIFGILALSFNFISIVNMSNYFIYLLIILGIVIVLFTIIFKKRIYWLFEEGAF